MPAILSSPLKLIIVFIKVFTDYIIRDVANMNFLKVVSDCILKTYQVKYIKGIIEPRQIHSAFLFQSYKEM